MDYIKIKNKIIRLLRLVILLFIVSVNSFAEEGNEYSIKAMFVLNFMKYVEWPGEAGIDVFKIGVAGESEIFDALLNMTNHRQENIKIKIEKANPDVIENYQILIITKNEYKRIDEWVKKYQGKGILIITEEFKNTNNAAINLLNINNKIRFEINNSQARRDGIKISSKLADMAVSVIP